MGNATICIERYIKKGMLITASNNSKYSQEVREETAKFIIESGKSVTSVGEEILRRTVIIFIRYIHIFN